MLIAKVVGSVVSTRKCESLVGNKFMIVEAYPKFETTSKRFIAVDNVGAGMGETVLVATGSAARIGVDEKDVSIGAPIDAAIVGIIDDVSSIG